MIQIYTDGASLGNPGKGGYGALLRFGVHTKEISKGFLKTTNNRMELWAVIAALEALKRADLNVEIYSDSSYVVNAIEKGWLNKWLSKKNFAKKKNEDLWRKLHKQLQLIQARFVWIRGHAGHIENERCDFLARDAAQRGPWERDLVYEKEAAALVKTT